MLDYLWGQPMQYILTAFAATKPRRIRIVLIGEMAGATIPIASGIFRSTKIEMLGSGIGSISPSESGEYMKNEVPQLLQLVADGKLKIDIETVELKDIEKVWQKEPTRGKRMVVRI